MPIPHPPSVAVESLSPMDGKERKMPLPQASLSDHEVALQKRRADSASSHSSQDSDHRARSAVEEAPDAQERRRSNASFYRQPLAAQSTPAFSTFVSGIHNNTSTVSLTAAHIFHDPATRFPLARTRENKEFHLLFKNVPSHDSLITSYSCAYQSDVLVQGRIWISQHHVCFRGWQDDPLILAFDRITTIAKKNIALFIPNSIQIELDHKTKYFFATFFARDETYNVLMRLWNAHNRPVISLDQHSCTCQQRGSCESCTRTSFSSHPSSQDSVDFSSQKPGETATTPVLRPKKSLSNLRADVEFGIEHLDHHVEKVDKEKEKEPLATELPTKFETMPRLGTAYGLKRSESLKQSPKPATLPAQVAPITQSPTQTLLEPLSTPVETTTHVTETRLFTKQKKTTVKRRMKRQVKSTDIRECECAPELSSRTKVLDKEYDVGLDRLFHLLFSPKSLEPGQPSYLMHFLQDVRRHKDVKISNWVGEEALCQVMNATDTSLHPTNFLSVDVGDVRKTSFIVSLSHAIGPKQTLCLNTETILRKKSDGHICIENTTQTPDVPSGGSFYSRTRTCLMYAGPNRTRMNVCFDIEFTKSSWIRGAIEKGTGDGIRTHYQLLDKDLTDYLSRHAEEEDQDSEKETEKNGFNYSVKRMSMVESMRTRRRSALVEGSLQHQKMAQASHRVLQEPESLYSPVSSITSELPADHSVLGYMKNRLKPYYTHYLQTSLPKWFSLLAWIHVLVLLVINLMIVWRMSVVMERYDERILQLQRDYERVQSQSALFIQMEQNTQASLSMTESIAELIQQLQIQNKVMDQDVNLVKKDIVQ